MHSSRLVYSEDASKNLLGYTISPCVKWVGLPFYGLFFWSCGHSLYDKRKKRRWKIDRQNNKRRMAVQTGWRAAALRSWRTPCCRAP